MGKKCEVCFRHCELKEGEIGFCGARSCRDGRIVADNYAYVTSLALDPIEKKPLNNFYPGSYVLSVGSYGCNLRCPFCQNHSISWSEEAFSLKGRVDRIFPDELVDIALRYKSRGNIGLAFTYNEPLTGYEYVLDAAKISHDKGLKNVLVSNGMASEVVLDKILPYIDAMNIDLKSCSEEFYSRLLRGNLDMVKNFIKKAANKTHVELTTLIIPGENDSVEEMEEICRFIAGLREGSGRDIPFHISRFFPRFNMRDRDATDVGHLFRLADIAKKYLEFVYVGNV